MAWRVLTPGDMAHHWRGSAGLLAVCLVAIGAACGGGGGSTGSAGPEAGLNPVTVDAGRKHDSGSVVEAGRVLTSPTLVSLAIEPPTATVTSLDGATATAGFAAMARYSDGSSSMLPASWLVSAPQLGAIDGNGLFTASGTVGGVVTLQASASGMSATATVTVVLALDENPAAVSAAVQAALTAATAADPSVVLAYPYDGTVWPRGILPPILQWNGGAATDDYLVQVTSPTFTMSLFTTATGAPSSQVALDAASWEKLTDSTTGAVAITVARWNGTAATRVARQTWSIAPGSMRGTIYYWANNLGRIMRIKPGASTPEDFSAAVVPSPGNGCTMACHTVSADGSTLIATGGTFGGTYDLKQNAPRFALGGAPDSPQIRQWALAAVTADGHYVVADALGPQLTGLPVAGMFNAGTGVAIPTTTSGLGTELYYMPAFSPDGSRFVFVGDTDPMSTYWAATATPGPLKSFSFSESGSPMMTNEQVIVDAGSDPTKQTIAYPTVSPDGRWALYSRMSWADPTTNHNLTSYAPMTSDLYLADLDHPGVEIRLGALDGDGYPFAAPAGRDLHLNFEPTFAPTASGGYFWVVFLSRRTYGNILTGDRTTEKQLWVAAIDQNPVAGTDPSHAAFHLDGQDISSLNLRGYWALDPCKGEGQGCHSGTECCGGYCDEGAVADGGVSVVPDASVVTDARTDGAQATGPVCKSSVAGCSQDGNHCNQTSDCCGAATGESCINHVCSVPTPH